MYFSGCHEPDELSCVSAWILRTVLVSNGHLMMIFEIFHAFRSGWYFISRPPQGVSKCTPPWKVKSRRDDAGMLQKQHKRSGSSRVCQFFDSYCCSKDLFKTTMATLRSKYFSSYTYDEIGIKADVNEMNRC